MCDSTTTTPVKRRRTTSNTPIEKKIETVQELEKGVNINVVAELNSVTPSSLRRWKQQSPVLSQFGEGTGADKKKHAAAQIR